MWSGSRVPTSSLRREAMRFLARTSDIAGAEVRDPMLTALEHRISASASIEWLFDNGDCRIATRSPANFRTGLPLAPPMSSFKLAYHKLGK